MKKETHCDLCCYQTCFSFLNMTKDFKNLALFLLLLVPSLQAGQDGAHKQLSTSASHFQKVARYFSNRPTINIELEDCKNPESTQKVLNYSIMADHKTEKFKNEDSPEAKKANEVLKDWKTSIKEDAKQYDKDILDKIRIDDESSKQESLQKLFSFYFKKNPIDFNLKPQELLSFYEMVTINKHASEEERQEVYPIMSVLIPSQEESYTMESLERRLQAYGNKGRSSFMFTPLPENALSYIESNPSKWFALKSLIHKHQVFFISDVLTGLKPSEMNCVKELPLITEKIDSEKNDYFQCFIYALTTSGMNIKGSHLREALKGTETCPSKHKTFDFVEFVSKLKNNNLKKDPTEFFKMLLNVEFKIHFVEEYAGKIFKPLSKDFFSQNKAKSYAFLKTIFQQVLYKDMPDLEPLIREIYYALPLETHAHTKVKQLYSVFASQDDAIENAHFTKEKIRQWQAGHKMNAISNEIVFLETDSETVLDDKLSTYKKALDTRRKNTELDFIKKEMIDRIELFFKNDTSTNSEKSFYLVANALTTFDGIVQKKMSDISNEVSQSLENTDSNPEGSENAEKSQSFMSKFWGYFSGKNISSEEKLTGKSFVDTLKGNISYSTSVAFDEIKQAKTMQKSSTALGDNDRLSSRGKHFR